MSGVDGHLAGMEHDPVPQFGVCDFIESREEVVYTDLKSVVSIQNYARNLHLILEFLPAFGVCVDLQPDLKFSHLAEMIGLKVAQDRQTKLLQLQVFIEREMRENRLVH